MMMADLTAGRLSVMSARPGNFRQMRCTCAQALHQIRLLRPKFLPPATSPKLLAYAEEDEVCGAVLRKSGATLDWKGNP
jgi:hypothetical protein